MQAYLNPLWVGLVVLIGGSPCSAAAAPPPVEGKARIELVALTDPQAAAIRRHGETAMNWLGRRLVTEINAAVQRDGPESAAAMAHLRNVSRDGQILPGMPSIAAIKLTSLQLLNVANAPDAAEQQVLDHMAREIRLGNPSDDIIIQRITAADGSTEWRAYRPLAVLSVCRACHGDPAAQSPRLQSLLRQHAPADDAAVGYETGEWRGLLRVTVKVPSS